MHLTVPGELPQRGIAAATAGENQRRIARRSLLLWGEHCTECAMPDCYATCAFYTPRADFKCRRFAKGIELIATGGPFPALGVSFRQWGKLEAEGRLSSIDPAIAGWTERACGWIEQALAATAPFARLQNFLIRGFNRAKRIGLPHLGRTEAPNAFMIECTSDTPQSVEFTLTIRSKDGARAFFQKNFSMAPGYNDITINARLIEEKVSLAGDLLVQLEPLTIAPDNHFVFTFLDFAHTRSGIAAPTEQPAEPRAEKIPQPAFCKCVVWDLDNTVWQGTLIEDGLDHLKLDPDAVAAIKELDRRGILQSIASKNNERDALDALDHFGLREFFLYPQIHWGPKSGSVTTIAARLNIGVDSLAIIDDQPFELAEVTTAIPSVTPIPTQTLKELLARPIFDVPVTAESQRRRVMYREDEQRTLASQTADTDFAAFLRGCAIELTLAPLDDGNRERVFELTQRTNQLNYAGRRCSRQAIEALAQDDRRRAYVLSCRDRFGDYGIIGFAVLDREAFEVEDFFMSCRVQNKFVDHAFFGVLAAAGRQTGRTALAVRFRATGRNEPAREALAEMGFRAEDAGADGATRFVIATAAPLTNDDIVAVIDQTASRSAAVAAGAGA